MNIEQTPEGNVDTIEITAHQDMQSVPFVAEHPDGIASNPAMSSFMAASPKDKKRPWHDLMELEQAKEQESPGKHPKMAIGYLLCGNSKQTVLANTNSTCSEMLTRRMTPNSCRADNTPPSSNPFMQMAIEETSSEVSAEQPTSRREFQCDQCPKSFKERGNLTKHKRSVHAPRSNSFQCDVGNCTKSFSFRDGLNRHKSTVHEGIRAYECPFVECDKRFKQRSHLRKHLRTVHKDLRMEPRRSDS